MTKHTFIRGGLGLLLVGLLAAPFIVQRWSDQAPNEALDRETALERYGFVLEEVSQEVGINFTHQPPELDPRLDHIMPEVASVGASVSVVDYNTDGHPDLYVTNSAHGTANALYRNEGDGTFTDVAPELGLAHLNTAETGSSVAAVWGDYNNDGYEDLFLYKWGRCELFRNEEGSSFTRVTDQLRGLPEWINANTAVWLDVNRDGNLDLFVGGFYAENVNLWDLETTRMMPESYEYATNGGKNYLFINQGDGSFVERGEEWGLTSRRWAHASAATDITGSGYPDLFVANDFGVDELYINENGERFRLAGDGSKVGERPKSGMNATFGDVMNQGRWSLYVSNISEDGVLVQGNNLWIPDGDDSSNLSYDNLAGAMGVEKAGWSYAAQFGDLNNDGWLDLFVTNGFVSGETRQSYWYDFSKVAGGHRSIIEDAENWPAMEGRSLSGYEQNRLWLNDGAGQFQDVAPAVGGASDHDGRAVALVDLWDRGVQDIVVAHQRGPLLVYRNEVDPSHAWIAFELTGTESNRSAIGTEVELHWNEHTQVQQVSGGSGYASQNQRRLHFGLGPDPDIEKAVIRWPSGTTQTIEALEANTVHEVKEP